jgi:hypothetical protein
MGTSLSEIQKVAMTNFTITAVAPAYSTCVDEAPAIHAQ